MTRNSTFVKERWADRIRAFISADAEPIEVGPDGCPPLPDMFQVTDLPKTDTERTAIDETRAAVRELCEALGGKDPGPLPHERVHVLDEEQIMSKIAKNRSTVEGKTWHGHVYVKRKWPLPVFMGVLAHEMMHEASYFWLDIRGYPSPTVGGLRVPKIIERRSGMLLIDPSYGTLLPHFHGLNECVTETISLVVRETLAKRSSLLDDAQRRQLKAFTCSPPLMTMMDRRAELVAGPERDNIGTWQVIMKDYLTGTDEFLRRLEPLLPGATERLRRTGARPEELLAAAEDLGLTNVAEKIRPYEK